LKSKRRARKETKGKSLGKAERKRQSERRKKTVETKRSQAKSGEVSSTGFRILMS